jgi:hypothetical protein
VKNYLKIVFTALYISIFVAIPALADNADVPPEVAAQEREQEIQANRAAESAHKDAKGPTYYNYAHDEAEYSLNLPEAPSVRTIWLPSSETSPFLKSPPSDRATLGEVATFKRTDIDTEETYDVKITFLRAKQSFLEDLNEDKIKYMLTKQYSNVVFSNESFTMSGGTGALKWATLSGFTLDSHHHPAFCAIHYLTGLQSILVIQAKYSVENKNFQEYYKHMIDSVTYVAP